jgi:hypothetical protein
LALRRHQVILLLEHQAQVVRLEKLLDNQQNRAT